MLAGQIRVEGKGTGRQGGGERRSNDVRERGNKPRPEIDRGRGAGGGLRRDEQAPLGSRRREVGTRTRHRQSLSSEESQQRGKGQGSDRVVTERYKLGWITGREGSKATRAEAETMVSFQKE